MTTEIQTGGGWWKATDGEWYPPRWEYRIIESSRTFKFGQQAFVDELAAAGLEGWEVTSVIGDPSKTVMATLKRPIRP